MHRLNYLGMYLMIAGIGVTFIFLADIQDEFDLPAWGVGMIASFSFVASVLMSIAVSPLADRGSLLPLAVSGVVAAIVGNVGFALSSSLLGFVLSRSLVGVGIGLFGVVARKALIGDDMSNSGERLGAMLSAGVAGFITGPALGALLADAGRQLPSILVAIAIAIVAVPWLWWLRSVPLATEQRVRVRDMRPLLSRPGARAALFGQMAVMGNVGVFDSTVDRYLTDLGVSDIAVALALIAIGSPLLFLPTRVGAFVDRTQPGRLMVLAMAGFAIVVAMMGFWQVLAAFIVIGVCQAVVESTVMPSAGVLMVRETGAAQSAIGQTLLDSVGQLLAAATSIVAPIAYAAWGARGSFGGSAVMIAVLMLLARREVSRLDGPTAVRFAAPSSAR